MGLRFGRGKTQNAFGALLRGAACLGLAAALSVSYALPVPGALGRAFADEGQDASAASAQEVVTGELNIIDSSLSEGGLLVGTSRDFDAIDAFKPLSDGEHEDWGEQWEGEDSVSRMSSTNYTVASSDPTVATIETVHSEGGRTTGSLHVEAKSVGTATFTIDYRYQGTYGIYEARQVVDVVVVGDSNPITSIECDHSVRLPMVEKCAICGQSHANMENTIIPVSLKVQDPSKPYTSDQVVHVKSSDESVISAWGDTCASGNGVFHVHTMAHAKGKVEVSLTIASQGSAEPVAATIEVSTVDMGAPSYTLQDDLVRDFAVDDYFVFRSFMTDYLMSYDHSVVGWWPYCTNLEDFDGFKGTVNGEEVTVLSVESDNDDIAFIGDNGVEEGHRLVFKKAGTVHVTFKDIWNQEATVTVRGVDREAEAKKLSLSRNELTIKQGEAFDLQTLVQGMDDLDPVIASGEDPMFRSSDSDTASVEWRQEPDGHGQVSWIVGNKVGDVAVKAGLRKSGQPAMGEDFQTCPLAEFGTLTVHVVADEPPAPEPQPVTGVALDKSDAVIVGANTLKLTATVAPDNATDKSVSWSSSNKAVATVDASGTVTAVGKGEAAITATSADGKHSATCAVKVRNPVSRVELKASTSLIKGAAETLEATLAGDLPGEFDEPKTLNWSSNNESVVAVSGSGAKATISALKSGSASVRLVVQTETRVDNDTVISSLKMRDCLVTVTNPARSIAISGGPETATVGDESFTLKATVFPADADEAVTWTSSDTKVAAVDANGTVIVKSAGSATITAKAGTATASHKLTVNSRQITAAPQESGFAASVIVSDSETAKVLDKYADEGVNLVVESIAELTEPAKAAIEKLTADGAKVADKFDIRFEKDNGDTIVLSTDKDGKITLTVKVALTGSMKALLNQGLALKVHYVGPDGVVEEKQTWVEGDSLYFVTEHFSDYVVMGVPQEEKGATTTPTALPKASSEDGGKKLAATGDTLAPVTSGVSVAALAACAMLAVAMRRRKSMR